MTYIPGSRQVSEAAAHADLLYSLLCNGIVNGAVGIPDELEPSLDDEVEMSERFSAFVASLPPGPRLCLDRAITAVYDGLPK